MNNNKQPKKSTILEYRISLTDEKHRKEGDILGILYITGCGRWLGYSNEGVFCETTTAKFLSTTRLATKMEMVKYRLAKITNFKEVYHEPTTSPIG